MVTTCTRKPPSRAVLLGLLTRAGVPESDAADAVAACAGDASLLLACAKVVADGRSVRFRAGFRALSELYSVRDRLNGGPLALFQLHGQMLSRLSRAASDKALEAEQARDLLGLLPVNARDADLLLLAKLHIRARCSLVNAAPESVDADEFESGGLRWASRLPAGDSDRSLLALHSSAYSAASVCTGDRHWQWRLCSLRLLVRCNQDDESERFTRCLFKTLEGQDDGRQNEVFVALLNVVDQIGHDQCVTSSLKWLYRAVRLACIRSDRNTLRRLLGVIDSISSRDSTLQELASWWRILAREGVSAALAASSRALSMSHESDSVALESFRLGMDIVRRQFLAVNAGDCSTGMALISLVDQNPDLASHFSILFEKSSDALSNLEYLIRCFQCSFHVATCAIERIVSLVRLGQTLLQRTACSTASRGILIGTLYNACVLIYNQAEHLPRARVLLENTLSFLVLHDDDPVRFGKCLDMLTTIHVRQGAPDPFVHFRGYFRQCAAVGDQDRRQTFLESAIHSYVKHQHRLGSDHNATGTAADLLDSEETADDLRLLVLELELDVYGSYPSGSLKHAKICTLERFVQLRPGRGKRFDLVALLRNVQRFDDAKRHVMSVLDTCRDKDTQAQCYVWLAQLEVDQSHDLLSVARSQELLDKALNLRVCEAIPPVPTCLRSLVSEIAGSLQSSSLPIELTVTMNDLDVALALEAQCTRKAYVPLAQTCLLLLRQRPIVSPLVIDVVRDLCGLLPIASLPCTDSTLTAIRLRQLCCSRNISGLTSAVCETDADRAQRASSIAEVHCFNGDLIDALVASEAAVRFEYRASGEPPISRLPQRLFHHGMLLEMAGFHVQAHYYLRQCVESADSLSAHDCRFLGRWGLARIAQRRKNAAEASDLLAQLSETSSTLDLGFAAEYLRCLDCVDSPATFSVPSRDSLRKGPAFLISCMFHRLCDTCQGAPQSGIDELRGLANDDQLSAIARCWAFTLLAKVALLKTDTTTWTRAEQPSKALQEARLYLGQAWQLSWNAPVPDLRRTLSSLTTNAYGITDPIVAAFALSSGMAVTAQTEVVLDGRSFEDNALETQFARLALAPTTLRSQAAKLQSSCIDRLPAQWTVVMVKLDGDHLVLCTMRRKQTPLIVRRDVGSARDLLSRFDEIISESHESMKASAETAEQRRGWWSARIRLDRQLNDLLVDLERDWISFLKGCFLDAVDDHVVSGIAERFSIVDQRDIALLHVVIRGSRLLTSKQLEEAVSYLGVDESLVSVIRGLQFGTDNLAPTVLILDSSVQHLPWESLPMLADRPVARLPCLSLLVERLGRSDFTVDSSLSFYVLNPSSNLPQTQARLEPEFKQRPGWQGLVGVPPTPDQLRDALSTYDLFLYCGHSAGEQYLPAAQIRKHQVRSASLLLGCSSGLLRGAGEYEPRGMCLAYLQAGCPVVLGNLWDVTDVDIDRFSQALLHSWLDEPAADRDLCASVSSARRVCKLKSLVGASPVCYGIPVRTRNAPARPAPCSPSKLPMSLSIPLTPPPRQIDGLVPSPLPGASSARHPAAKAFAIPLVAPTEPTAASTPARPRRRLVMVSENEPPSDAKPTTTPGKPRRRDAPASAAKTPRRVRRPLDEPPATPSNPLITPRTTRSQSRLQTPLPAATPRSLRQRRP
ncbi:unnamed protein product (mitochondrion) [Plasmodiophora brassicae]|uniref:separase n=1 Tax=Plasmodiophora brassicae TaxID=37360 RepID=A0A3P3YAA3_PLABS|nr:unnamed protein product [Plasmodiophora brassicae]